MFHFRSRRAMGYRRTDPDTPPGWLAVDGLLQPDPTVAGYMSRGQEAKGVCHLRDCWRRCEVDLQRLAARGFGPLPITAAQAFLKCHSLTGCGLEFHDEPRTSLPLRALVGRSHVKIRIKCASCGFFRAATPESVLAKLSAEKHAPDGLLVSEVAARIKGPCRQCRKSAWRVDVLWPNIDSVGYRRSLET